MELPPTVTSVTLADMLVAMRDAYVVALGSTPKQEVICTLVAQWAFETGGGHACVAYNLGNFKAVAGGPGDWTHFTTFEMVAPAVAKAQVDMHPDQCAWDGHVDAQGRAKLVVHPPHPWCCFRAYRTLAEACGDYLHVMYTRFEPAWSRACEGDPEAFARELGACGYYTSSADDYAAGCRRWFTKLLGMPWTDAPEPGLPPILYPAVAPKMPGSDPEGTA